VVQFLLLLGLDPLQVLLVDVRLDIAAVEAAVAVGVAVEQHFVFVGLVANRPGALDLTGVDIRAPAFRAFLHLHSTLVLPGSHLGHRCLQHCLGDGRSLALG